MPEGRGNAFTSIDISESTIIYNWASPYWCTVAILYGILPSSPCAFVFEACCVLISSNGAVANEASSRAVDPAISGIYGCRLASSISSIVAVDLLVAKFVT